MQRALIQAPQRVLKQRLFTTTQRSVHNASNPHQSKQPQQIHTQPTPSHSVSEIEATPLTNILSNGQDLIKYTHNHIRTQRFSPADRMYTQLYHFEQLQSNVQNNVTTEMSRFPTIAQRYQQIPTQLTQYSTEEVFQASKNYSL
jgi:hypothetical protein